MNALMISSAVASVAVVVGLLIGMARHGAKRELVQSGTVSVLAPATISPAGAHCSRTGHHYVRRETGWCCGRCGDEVVADARSSLAVAS
jgi:hypothetical protein